MDDRVTNSFPNDLRMADWISTKKATEILGVGATTIRRLADTDQLPSIRTPGGHRRFERSALEKMVRQNNKSPGANKDVQHWMQLLRSEPCRQILAELQSMRLRHADWYEVSDFIVKVIQRIRELSACGEYSVIEAQISSSTLQQALGTLAATSAAPALAKTALLGKIGRETHAPRLSLTQLCLESSGIDTVWAGTNLPARQLASYINSADVEIVALSAPEARSDNRSLADSYRMIVEVCRQNAIELILGGREEWAGDLRYGHRCNSYADLRTVVAAL